MGLEETAKIFLESGCVSGRTEARGGSLDFAGDALAEPGESLGGVPRSGLAEEGALCEGGLVDKCMPSSGIMALHRLHFIRARFPAIFSSGTLNFAEQAGQAASMKADFNLELRDLSAGTLEKFDGSNRRASVITEARPVGCVPRERESRRVVGSVSSEHRKRGLARSRKATPDPDEQLPCFVPGAHFDTCHVSRIGDMEEG